MASLESASFVPLACVRVANARLLASACSPDKDLFVLLTRAQNKDRLALWKIKGAKKWEVEVCVELPEPESVKGVAWSPDGLSILVAHHPPRLSLHSIQDGREIQSIPVEVAPDARLTGVWWLKNTPKPVPDVWKRDELIPGSALSTLSSLPLLDPFKDYSQNQGAQGNSFAFGGAATGASRAPSMPAMFLSWPALAPNLQLSSIAPSEFIPQDQQDDENLDRDSLVVATDSTGALHFFLDGVYSFGAVRLGTSCSVTSLAAPPPDAAHIVAHARSTGGTNARPLPVHLDMLRARLTRDIAQVSSAARDLLWYALRVVREMRETWVGNGSGEAVAGLGKRFVKAHEARIKFHTPHTPQPIFELTLLLTTGRISDSLHDVLTGSDKMAGNERPPNINRWETLMTDALTKLRDYSERRVSPACQRLLVVLQDVRGWSKMPREADTFLLEESEIDEIILLVRRAIELSAWLASVARDELERFRHFISWLKTESMNANSDATTLLFSFRHDILEVNDYIMRGLTGSVLDGWFFDGEHGSVPRDAPSDRRAPRPVRNLAAALAEAKKALEAKAAPDAYAAAHERKQLDGVERNVEALLLDVAKRCSKLFRTAAGAVTRTAVFPEGKLPTGSVGSGSVAQGLLMCERAGVEAEFETHYSALYLRSHKKLCVLRVNGCNAEATVFECETASAPVELLAMDFFDGETIAAVLRPEGQDQLYISLIDYASAAYTLITDSLTGAACREQLAADVASALVGESLPIRQSRQLRMRLAANDPSQISIAVNGRVGRRVGCVHLPSTGELETFDLEGEEEDEEMVDASF